MICYAISTAKARCVRWCFTDVLSRAYCAGVLIGVFHEAFLKGAWAIANLAGHVRFCRRLEGFF